MKVRNVTPQSTGMATSSRRPVTRRAGEPARRRCRGAPPAWRPGSAPGLSGCPTVTEVFIVITVRAFSSVGVVDVLPEDSRIHDDARDRRGQPRSTDALGGDVVSGDREEERPVRLLGDVGGQCGVVLGPGRVVDGRSRSVDQVVDLLVVDAGERQSTTRTGTRRRRRCPGRTPRPSAGTPATCATGRWRSAPVRSKSFRETFIPAACHCVCSASSSDWATGLVMV